MARGNSQYALAIVIPVFNDWQAFQLLLKKIGEICKKIDGAVHVIVVDDGSAVAGKESATNWDAASLERLTILRLVRNCGHQRAIALGLAYCAENISAEFVAVMDGDGEDRPEELLELLKISKGYASPHVLFAARAKRKESIGFKVGYTAFRIVHRILVGFDIRVGNFSMIPSQLLRSVTLSSELWNHYAAAVFQARIPNDRVPIDRGDRLFGSPRMDTVSLIVHGLSALSVYTDRIGGRMLVGTCAGGSIFSLLSLSFFVCRHLGLNVSNEAIYISALIAGFMFFLAVITFTTTVLVLRNRSSQGFIPIRDYHPFIGAISQIELKLEGKKTDTSSLRIAS